MSKRILTREDGLAAVYGGCILGGGGGGILSDGEAKTHELFDRFPGPQLISTDELDDADTVACVALVGAPSAMEASLSVEQMTESVELLRAHSEQPVVALMTNENGASTSINGWLQAAILGLPVLDSPANGRAHPTGSMGAMGLHAVPGYRSVQGFSGGRGEQALSGVVQGDLGRAADVVRQISVHAGGLVSVCRNAVSVGYLREHAALGGITQAIELGRTFLGTEPGPARISAVIDELGAEVLTEGRVSSVTLEQQGGFDVGAVRVGDLDLTFCNEYMTAERAGQRLATFPELIMTLDAGTGRPMITAEMSQGQRVVVIRVGVRSLLLGSPMRDLDLLGGIEHIIKHDIISHQEELWH